MGHSPIRNRLAKPLPEPLRRVLIELGVPKRKYTAVCRVTLEDGRVVEEAVIEEGWVIALSPAALADAFEQRIDFDPRRIASLELVRSL